MATVVQRPGVPTKIAPLLTGEEGNGKNFFFDMFAAILGPPHHTVISATRIFDRFNGSVEGKSLVFVNEMDTLTKKEMASVNILITDPTASIERKGQERRYVKNVANFVFVSNVLHRDLFPDLGTTKRRFVHLSSRNVNKNPVLWSHFWEWSGGNMIDPTGKNPENSSTTRKICNGSLALADFLYNRKVTRRIDEIPVHENGSSCMLRGLQDVPQWWKDCLTRGVILGSSNQTPWDTERSAFSGPSRMKWIELKDPFRLFHSETFEAFKGWYKNSNMGIQNIQEIQFVRQMNEILLGRTELVPRKRLRSSKKTGQKTYWMIDPLLDERRKFSLLYGNISFDDADDQLTDAGTIPIDRFGVQWIDDYKALSEGLPTAQEDGNGDPDGNDQDDVQIIHEEEKKGESSEEEDGDDGEDDVDFDGGGSDDDGDGDGNDDI